MSETITTAAELDALPGGSIVARLGVFPEYAIAKADTNWYTCGDDKAYVARDVVRAGTLTVLYRPDRQPRPESVVKAEARRDAAAWARACTEAGDESTAAGRRVATWAVLVADERNAAEAAIGRVRALHTEVNVNGSRCCDQCDGNFYPCPTILALEGVE